MFRILPRTLLSSLRLSAAALFLLLLLPAAVQALPATVPTPAAPAPAPAPATSGPLETAWAWLASLFAPDATVATRETPVDELDGAAYNLVPIFFEGSHLDPNGGF